MRDTPSNHADSRVLILGDAHFWANADIDFVNASFRFRGAFSYLRHVEVDCGWNHRIRYEHAIRNLTSQPCHLGSVGCEVDWDTATDRSKLETPASDGDNFALHGNLFATPKPSDDVDRFAQGRQWFGNGDPQLLERGPTESEPKNGATAGELIQRGHGCSRNRGMTGIRIRDAGAQRDSRCIPRERRKPDKALAK